MKGKFKIGTKLLLVTVTITVLVIFVSGVLAILDSKSSVREQAVNHLVAVRDMEGQQIEDYLRLIRGQAITMSEDRVFEVIDEECVACNLCVNVCPVEGCITMEELEAGAMDLRTGKVVDDHYANWTTHPNNPAAVKAAE